MKMELANVPLWGWALLMVGVALVAFVIVRTKRWWTTLLLKQLNEMEEKYLSRVQQKFAEVGRDVIHDGVAKLLTEQMVNRIVSGVPEACTAQISRLSEQVSRLAEESRRSPWVDLPVQVRGFQGGSQLHLAVVSFNTNTDDIVAPQPSMRMIVPMSEVAEYRKRWESRMSQGGSVNPRHYYRDAIHPLFECLSKKPVTLGAPEYNKVDGNPDQIVMLGAIYSTSQIEVR